MVESKCNRQIFISAWLNDENNPLQARVDTVQDWEKFIAVVAGDGYIGLKAYANNKYVGAWLSETNTPLQARETDIQNWQMFQWRIAK